MRMRHDLHPAKSDVRVTDGAKDVVRLTLDRQHSINSYAAAREKGPVVSVSFAAPGQDTAEGKQEAQPGSLWQRDHLFVARYDEVLSTLIDGRFSSDARSMMSAEQHEKRPPVPEELRPFAESLIGIDPPDHTRLRKLIQPIFSPRRMEAMRPRIQKIVDDLLDRAERAAQERGEAYPDRRMDLIEAFAFPLPVTVISDILGIPEADRERVRLWTEPLHLIELRAQQTDWEIRTKLRQYTVYLGGLLLAKLRRPEDSYQSEWEVRTKLRQFTAYLGGLLLAKLRRPEDSYQSEWEIRAKLRQFTAYLGDLFSAKRKQPQDDVISYLLQAEEEGDKLKQKELLSTVFALYIAGHLTTVNLIGNGVFALLSHPAEFGKLRADGGLAKAVVEETLRYWSPVEVITRRIAKEDLNLCGRHVPKGEPVMVGVAAANRDPQRFADPDTFNITRSDADRHVAFGKGIHHCLGAPLARLEGEIAFETLFRRLPELRLAVPVEKIRWSKTFLRGLSELPVLF
jgi:cytochrome P450